MSKIDPKVFFANERTFLKWLHTSVEIGSIASLLLGFRAIVSGDDERPGLDILRVSESCVCPQFDKGKAYCRVHE